VMPTFRKTLPPQFSGLWHRVVMWYDAKVSEELAASIFMVLLPYSVAIRYQSFGEPCYLHLQGEVHYTASQPPRRRL
jgi:hypothetical protein